MDHLHRDGLRSLAGPLRWDPNEVGARVDAARSRILDAWPSVRSRFSPYQREILEARLRLPW